MWVKREAQTLLLANWATQVNEDDAFGGHLERQAHKAS